MYYLGQRRIDSRKRLHAKTNNRDPPLGRSYGLLRHLAAMRGGRGQLVRQSQLHTGNNLSKLSQHGGAMWLRLRGR